MHYRLIITTEAKDRLDAVERVTRWLEPRREDYVRNPEIDEDDEGAYTRQGFWDWYVIGGRWSGNLMLAYIPDFWDIVEQKKEAAQIKYFIDTRYSGKNLAQEAVYDELDTIWRNAVPNEFKHLSNPYRRDEYSKDGYPDDVLPINAVILSYIWDNWKPEPDEWNDIYSADLQGETPDETFVGRKWAVVVDYHN